MTGSEQSGFAAARDGLFRNATYIFTPTKETRADDVDYWRHAAEVIGANVVIMDPQVHDRIVAWTSQLPFIVASALTRSVLHSEIDNSMLRPLIAGGFRDTTRVASGEPRMSADMCSFNHKELLESLRQFRSALSKLETLLQQCEANNEPLFEELKRIKNGRDRLLEG